MQATQRDNRRAAILDLVTTRELHNQRELSEALSERGIEVNQGTLSRDLRDLGVLKGPDGYEPPRGSDTLAPDPRGRLHQALRQFLSSTTPAQNQIVLRTPPGGAQPLAIALDEAGLPDVLGTLAGDDTVLVITPDARTARRVARRLEAQA